MRSCLSGLGKDVVDVADLRKATFDADVPFEDAIKLRDILVSDLLLLTTSYVGYVVLECTS